MMEEERQDLPEEEIAAEAEELLEELPVSEESVEELPEAEELDEDLPVSEESVEELPEEEPVEELPVSEESVEELPEEELPADLPASEVSQEELAEAEVESEEEPVSQPVVEEEEDGRAWYVVHCYSGYENKVRHNLEQRIETMGMKNLIFDVVVPTEEEIEVKDGKRRTLERRVFPGYILVNMIMTEESWYVVRNTPGVTSFVGMGNEPVPLRPEEVSSIIKRMEADAPRIKVTFKPGERVRIIDGPFNDFRGTVDEIDMERAKVRVMVNFFGRETPVELDFLQVEKA
jgi:transcriptional antiterminator NusG